MNFENYIKLVGVHERQFDGFSSRAAIQVTEHNFEIRMKKLTQIFTSIKSLYFRECQYREVFLGTEHELDVKFQKFNNGFS